MTGKYFQIGPSAPGLHQAGKGRAGAIITP